ncbi:Nn.00g093540.m01.CDS01 [Neocucurbitaria sp. VM-36]
MPTFMVSTTHCRKVASVAIAVKTIAVKTIAMYNLGRPGFSTVSTGSLRYQAEYITPIGKDSLALIVSREDSPTGLLKLIVSRPHVEALSNTWNETIERRTSRNLLGATRTKQVVLPEDDADMIRLIMLIAHHQYAKLPRQLDLHELVRLASTVERYNVSRILMPHLEVWLAPHRHRIYEPGYEQWLYVAYHFGLEEEYLGLANHLVLHCRTDVQKYLLSSLGCLLMGRFPPQTLHIIKRLRCKLIDQMFQTMSGLLDEMRVSNHCQLRGASSHIQAQCTAVNKLRFERSLTVQGLMAAPLNASDVRISPLEIMQRLLDATIVNVMALSLRTNPSLGEANVGEMLRYEDMHEDCGVGMELKTRLDYVMKHRPLAADRVMINEIRRHAGQYGRLPFNGYSQENLCPVERSEGPFGQWYGNI